MTPKGSDPHGNKECGKKGKPQDKQHVLPRKK
jgi:hypothetical protein